MAEQLINSLTAEFEPEKYHDEYRERVLELIEAKASGQEIAIQPPEEPVKVPDLMAALEQSLAAATGGPGNGGTKSGATTKGRRSTSSAGNGSKKAGTAKKKSPASSGRSRSKASSKK